MNQLHLQKNEQSIGTVLWNVLTRPRSDGREPDDGYWRMGVRTACERRSTEPFLYQPSRCFVAHCAMLGEARRVCTSHRLHSHPASCLIIEVAGTVSIGGRPQVSLGGWFLFFRLRPCGVLFCAVSCICGVSERQFVPYSTVQFNLIGWPYDFPEMAAAFCLTVTEYLRVDTSRLPLFGSEQAKLQPFPELMWPC